MTYDLCYRFVCYLGDSGPNYFETVMLIISYITFAHLSCNFHTQSVKLSLRLYKDDRQVPTVKEEISRFSSHYNVLISVHPSELIASFTEPPIQRRLRRYWPDDLLVRF
jgi:hypothetical protein